MIKFIRRLDKKSINKIYKDRKGTLSLLLFMFLTAVFVRLLYFPNNIPFGYDQARDAYISLGILQGDFKILGPPSSFGVYHGALSYYLLSPLYLISKDPQIAALFFRIYNAFGVFLIFSIAYLLFKDKYSAIFSSLLFAFSFEQTQYSIFLGHPSFAVASVMLFYFGLILLFFRNEKRGLILTALGLSLSIQFHFSMIVLILVALLSFLIFNKNIPKIDKTTVYLSFAAFFSVISTYIISELKFGFPNTNFLINYVTGGESEGSPINLQNYLLVLARYVEDNIFSYYPLIILILIIFLAWRFIKNKQILIFLFLWVFISSFMYLFDNSHQPTYYYGIGASISIILIFSFVVSNIFKKSKLLGIFLLSLVVFANLTKINEINPNGTIPEINAQEGMLLSDQKQVIDYIYNNAQDREFSVYALTIPYKVNTTWSYLFEWYGKDKYGYLPIWGGEAAPGYEGNWEGVTSQSELPDLKFTIIEPTRGLPESLINDFMKQEDVFWTIEKEKRLGKFTIQQRQKLQN